MAEAEILRQAARIIGGTKKVVSVFQIGPLSSRKFDVAAAAHVVIHGNDEQRRSVGGCESVGIVFKPGNQACGLRDFVRNFAVFALKFTKKIEGCAGGGKVSGGVERELRPLGIAAKIPGKSRSLTVAGSPITGN